MIIIIDIETGSSKDALEFKPIFKANGTLKDPEKIKRDLEMKDNEWEQKTALNALTAEILAIGYLEEHLQDKPLLMHGNELDILKNFWETYTASMELGFTIVGHYNKAFDFPMIIRRSYKHGIPIVKSILEKYNPQIVDLSEVWSLNSYPKENISLDNLCKYLGVEGKSGSGKDFAKLFKDESTKQIALDYLIQDLQCTFECAKRLTNLN